MRNMRQMVDTLNTWARAYYTEDEPLVSDKEYDALYDALVEEERKTGTILPDSPTQRVGDEVLAAFEKYTHLAPLYSLDKAQSFEALKAWDERNRKRVEQYNASHDEALPPISYIVEYKFDGLTMNLTYDKGFLTKAATRGTGRVGEDITAQVRRIPSVPLSIESPVKMEIHGEGLMPLSALSAYNQTHDIPLKNARNAAAGALRNLDTRAVRERHLIAYFYNIGYDEGLPFTTDSEMKAFIKKQGFPTFGDYTPCETMDEVIERIDAIKHVRDSLDILIDGAVVKINDLRTRQVLGATVKFPRWAIAYKFEALEASTILEDVQWNVGRTGKVTPTAILQPVELGGVTISRSTLNNADDIARKGVRLHGRVLLRRSNDVIPEILGALPTEGPTKEIETPHCCPACHTKLVKDGVHIFCPNAIGCRPQLLAGLVHFCARDGMDIEGLSEKTLSLLLEKGLISQAADLFTLKEEDLLCLEGFKEKKTKKLLDSIEKSKQPELFSYINALGIPGVGVKTAQSLASHFHTFSRLQEATVEELVAIEDIGDITAEDIGNYFSREEIQRELQALCDAGVRPKSQTKVRESGPLEGTTVVITGTLSVGRKEMEEQLKALGAKVTGSVSKKTTFILAGDTPGSKVEKARALGIEILDEETLRKRLGGQDES